jgi:hypothetical protein
LEAEAAVSLRLDVQHLLVCTECDATSTNGVGWRGVLTVGDEEAEEIEEVAVYCPVCAAREFGQS